MRISITILFAFTAIVGIAQSYPLSIEEMIVLALKNNPGIKSSASEVDHQRQLEKTSFDLPKTEVSLLYGQYNSYATNDNNITVSQTLPWSALGSQGSLNRSLVAAAELKKTVSENELVYRVKQVYYELALVQARHLLLLQQDSIYEGFFKAATLRLKAGEANLLERTTAETQSLSIKNKLQQNEADIVTLRSQLKTLLAIETLPRIKETDLPELSVTDRIDTTTTTNPSVNYMRQQIDVAKRYKKLESAKAAPDLKAGFFSQTLIDVPRDGGTYLATSKDRFTGFHVGIALPIWIVPHRGRIRAAEYSRQSAEHRYQESLNAFQGQYQQALQLYQKNKVSLTYYRTSAIPNAELIIKHSQSAFRAGEIGYAQYLLGLHQAIAIKEEYLQTLNTYNQNIIYIDYLTGHQ